MQEDIITTLRQTTNDLLNTIESFPQEQFTKVPFEGSWTAAQVSEHLLKAESGLLPTWLGSTKPTARPVDEKVGIIKQVFLDFTHKMKSPEFILPVDNRQDKEDLYNSLKANRKEIERLATTLNLELTFTDFALPNLGNLTGIEWATFIICHSKRHIHQLQNIHKIVC